MSFLLDTMAFVLTGVVVDLNHVLNWTLASAFQKSGRCAAVSTNCKASIMKRRGDGRAALIEAAREQFKLHGYWGTNTNMIARAAGYAPQTFYRHFDDKRAIFIAVYEHWVESEVVLLSATRSADEMANVLIEHHRLNRVFRQSLRSLTVTDPEVGSVRARMRLMQADLLGTRIDSFGQLALTERLAFVLQVERLCDAIADGEFAACGVTEENAKGAVVAFIRKHMIK